MKDLAILSLAAVLACASALLAGYQKTEWPADLTVNIPKFEGQIKNIIRTSTPQGMNWKIEFERFDPDILTNYIKALEEKGWAIHLPPDLASPLKATKDKDKVELFLFTHIVSVTASVAK
jgi:hypothetical protein